MSNSSIVSRESLILEFPDLDPAYLDFLVNQNQKSQSGRDPQLVLQNCRAKLLQQSGHYPKRPVKSKSLKLHQRQTLWLKTLTELFPELDPAYLKQTISDQTRHAFSFTDILDFLLRETDVSNGKNKSQFRLFWFQQQKRLKAGSKVPAEADLTACQFHGELYDQQALSLLYNEFRLWKPILKSILVDTGSYLLAHRRVVHLRENHPWLFSFATGFLGYLQSLDAAIPEKELDSDIHAELDMIRKQKLQLQADQDRQAAIELNEQQYAQDRQMLECRCCFGDYTFEEMVQCSGDAHLICMRCVEHYLQEVIYGALTPADRGWIPCLAACTSDSRSCHGRISRTQIERVLKRDLIDRYERWVCDLDLNECGIHFVRCAVCSNVEFFEKSDVERLQKVMKVPEKGWFSLLFQSEPKIRPHWQPAIILTGRKVLSAIRNDSRILSIFFILLLTQFNIVILTIMFLFLVYAYVPVRRLPEISAQFLEKICNGSTSFLQKIRPATDYSFQLPIKQYKCSNCLHSTCLKCKQEWVGQHLDCAIDREQDQYRLFIERAMTNAVVRSCPGCGANLMKSDGCNKLVCKCGKSICYICRQDLKRDGYAHFCQHFRSIPGTSCQKCNKCDLWKSPDEVLAVEAAAQKAHEEWVRLHPEQ